MAKMFQKKIRSTRLKKKRLLKIIFVILLLWIVIQLFMPSFQKLTIYERMPNLLSGKAGLIVNGEIIKDSYPIIYEDLEVALPLNIIYKYVDDTILKNDNYVICANKNTYIRYEIDNNKYVINGKIKKGKIKPFEIDNVCYVPMTILKDLYGIDFKYYNESNILEMATIDMNRDLCIVINNSEMREIDSIKSSIVGNVVQDEIVIRYKDDGTWSLIVNEKGLVGYTKSQNLIHKEDIKNKVDENIELNAGTTYGEINVTLDKTDDGFNINVKQESKKINLLWFQVNSKSSNPKISDLENVDSITHACFTWFELINNDDNIKEKIDSDLVKWAHGRNYKVWALVTNPFSDSEMTHEILKDPVKRANAISKMIELSKKYNIDGINVDIESIKEKTGPFYVQFIKELSIFCHNNKLELSVDVYMPSESTKFYNRKQISTYCDYVIVMAYDEHWSTSKTAGSVSSLPWVYEGIQKTLNEVDKEKLVLGIPLYTRVWETDENNNVKSQKALSMENSIKDLENNNAKIVFDDETKQNYGEYKKDNSIFKIWIEDDLSQRERLELYKEFDLRGVALWKKNFENDELWNLYKEYFK